MASRTPQRRPGRSATSRTRGGNARRRTPPRAKQAPTLLGRVIRFVLVTGVISGLLIAAAVAGYLRYLDAKITRTFEGRRWDVPAIVYAQPLELYPGALLAQGALIHELERIGYRPVSGAPPPGSYARKGAVLDIHLREFCFVEGCRRNQRIRVVFDRDTLVEVSDLEGRQIPLIQLDPTEIGRFFAGGEQKEGGEDRIVLAPDRVPNLLTEALKIVEDKHFDTHHGFDLEGILRAIWVNLLAGKVEQGGSTLTQQLVKSYYLTNERTFERKFRELCMAVILEARFSKDEILNAYVNEIFLGQDGNRAIHGFGLGAQFYFNKPIDELGAGEIALLVAVIRGPTYYNPYRHPERALERRNLVLDRMLESRLISAREHAAAQRTALGISRGTGLGAIAYPAYRDLVRQQLNKRYRYSDLTQKGLRIFTNLNPPVQEAIEKSLTTMLASLEQNRRIKAKKLEGAVVVANVQTGDVIAVAGGRVAGFDGFNRALSAARPIGSLVKPVVYLKALESGYHLASIIEDAPVRLTLNGKTWAPNNYDRKINGPVPLIRGLGNSLNLATVNLGLRLGVESVADRLQALSGHQVQNRYPSLLLGAEAMSPLEIAQLYGTIASGGFQMSPNAVVAVLDETRQPLTRRNIDVEKRIEADVASTLQRAMEAVMRYGTGRGSRFARAGVAGKTGTTDDYRDSWFVGFDSVHLVVVWVGADDNAPTGLSGATGALKVWDDIMSQLSVRPLQYPPENRLRTIDYRSGFEADPTCTPEPVRIPLTAGTQLSPMPGCKIGSRTSENQSLNDRFNSWLNRF